MSAFAMVIVLAVVVAFMLFLHSLSKSDASGQYPPRRNPTAPASNPCADEEDGAISDLAQRLADSFDAGEWEFEYREGDSGGYKFTNAKESEYVLALYHSYYPSVGTITTIIPGEWMSKAEKAFIRSAMIRAISRNRLKLRDEQAQRERDEITKVLEKEAV